MNLLRGRWYLRGAEVGLVVPQVRLVEGTSLRRHVPNPQHVESTIWKLLGGPADNDCATELLQPDTTAPKRSR